MNASAPALAESHRQIELRSAWSVRLELRGLSKRFRQVFRWLLAQSRQAQYLPRGAEWLLDNDYVVQRAIRLVRDSLPAQFLRQLPVAVGSRRTRVRELCDYALDEGGSPVDIDWLVEALGQYQDVAELTTGELWALPAMLRLTILHRLLKVAETLVDEEHDVEGRAATIASLIVSLRTLETTDWLEFVERVSLVETTLSADPSGHYALMDQSTRDRYRQRVEQVARWSRTSETAVAQCAVELAREGDPSDRRAHVGYFLVDAGRSLLERSVDARVPGWLRCARLLRAHAPVLYPLCIVGLTLVSTAAVMSFAAAAGSPIWALAAAAPASLVVLGSVVTAMTNWTITQCVLPHCLPKLDFEKIVTQDCRAAVVVPAILDHPDQLETILARLEMNYLGNAEPNLHYVFLTDLADASSETTPDDDAMLDAARAGIEALCKRHRNGRFYWLHRPRRWNDVAHKWMGWERKRGKLFEFNRFLLNGDVSGFSHSSGRLDDLRHLGHVVTLDADTQLPTGAAQRLLGTCAHPLNKARLNDDGTIAAGYSIIQPRVETSPESANCTAFARVYAGDTLLDLYGTEVSDVYHDVIGSGIFAGKAVYDVVALESSLQDRVPDNAILSHDLFEGLHGRVGLASDVAVFEDIPPSVPAYMRRQHRWIRGDWQLLPWLGRRVPASTGGSVPSRFRTIDRWKILDNLQRSLLAPAVLGLLVIGWTVLPVDPLLWTLGWLAALAMPLWLGLLGGLLETAHPRARTRRALAGTGWTVRHEIKRSCLAIALLPYEALTNIDAILRTLYRMCFGRDKLLEWVPAAFAERNLGTTLSLAVVLREMRAALLTVLLVLVALLSGAATTALWSALPLVAVWLACPLLVQRLSRRTAIEEPQHLDPGSQRELRLLARKTWSFFEAFVGPESHWLPPDNLHEEPRTFLAERTSPTNIGVLLTSTMAAYDLGYLTAHGIAARLGHSLDSIERLEHHCGHLLNWYDTRTLTPLEPRYVSTVDSGNLVGSLLVVAEGIHDVLHAPLTDERLRQGLMDTIAVLRDQLVQHPSTVPKDIEDACDRLVGAIPDSCDPLTWRHSLQQALKTAFPALVEQVTALVEKPGAQFGSEEVATIRASLGQVSHQLRGVLMICDRLLPWLAVLDDAAVRVPPTWASRLARLEAPPPLADLPRWARSQSHQIEQLDDHPEHADLIRDLTDTLAQAAAHAEDLIAELRELRARCRRFARGVDFDFLYDRERHLFRIGYNVSAAEYDPNYYDLLASEARLASYIAIARGQVPVKHWLHLGRPFTRLRGRRVLVSWSATAFEYLMPRLFMAAPGRGLIEQSCQAMVTRQKRFAGKYGVPWGVSESALFELDDQSHYQYRAFGVPGLGLKREAAFRLVITPYASMLALPYAANDVVSNLRRLRELECLGRYGAFEALDFGNAGEQDKRQPRIVRSYMSHHQGMIMMALANALEDDVMVRRFQRNREMRRVAYLLFERLPPGVPGKLGYRSAGRPEAGVAIAAGLESWQPDPAAREIHALSNGALHAHLASHGPTDLAWRDIQLTRGHPGADLTSPSRRLYLHDADRDVTWQIGDGRLRPDNRVTFAPHEAQFHQQAHELRCRLDVAVAQDHDVEIQLLTLRNTSERKRRIRLVQYAEPVLAPRADDDRHPAFNKLFVEPVSVDSETIVFRRRLRGTHEQPLYLAQALVGASPHAVLCCTDRERFLGPDGNYREPVWLREARPGMLAAQPTLDPVAALGAEVMLHPQQTIELFWLTSVARSRAQLATALEHYRQRQHAGWAFFQSRYASERELRQLGLSPSRMPKLMKLVSRLFDRRATPSPELGRCNAIQGSLWARGVSGDVPVLLLHLRDPDDIELARDAIAVHRFCTGRGIAADLIIVDHVSLGYSQPTRDSLQRLVEQANRGRRDRHGRAVLLTAGDVPARDLRALQAAARVTLDSLAGPVEAQLDTPSEPAPLPDFLPMPSGPLPSRDLPALPRPDDLQLDNGLGGFDADGREYVIYLANGELPPQPWINVLANADFGSLVSASGAMFTWARNSGENRLTPWPNDPLRDPTGEAVYLRDEETGDIWTPTPRPCPAAQPYEVRHGLGYTSFRHLSNGLAQTLTVHVDPHRPVKYLTLTLRNQLDHPRRLTATAYAEWVLGNDRERDAPFVVSDYAREDAALLARNAFRLDRFEATAFVATDQIVHGITTDRLEFLGPAGDRGAPAALSRIGLSGSLDSRADPCAALQVHIDLLELDERTVCFMVGEAESREAALELIRYARGEGARSLAGTRAVWEDVQNACRVETPDPAMNLLLNRCLLYQTQACRVWARAALYQCGGGLGFRDQLQDVMALVAHQSRLARDQILDAARSQFFEGDVLHWWHTKPRRGVRTRCSDDLLWLPYVTAHYVAVTGDVSILAEELPFLHAAELGVDELERYAQFDRTEFSASLFEHCWRAIDLALTRRGVHGLPLIGTGDWNDGLSRVGVEGKGESVWLGWFMIAVCDAFIPLCNACNDPHRAAHYRAEVAELKKVIEANGWDGAWYLRAYYDDGAPLGASESDECRIDLNAQSWAVISGAADSARATQAMDSALRELVRHDERLILLLKPPFDKTSHDPGYIKGYPPGVRENGGQYTHAAIWAAWALADMGRPDDAWRLFDYLNPLARCTDRASIDRYRVEPYVMTADVYGAGELAGRGGWSWYTGAAGWMYRLGLERILGIRKFGDELEIDPNPPSHWSGFVVHWRHGASRYRIDVELTPGGKGRGVSITLDEAPVDGNRIPLLDDGAQHDVVCRVTRG